MPEKCLVLCDLIGRSPMGFQPGTHVMRRYGGLYYIPVLLCVYLPDFANKALAPANHNSLHCWWSVICLQSLMIRSTAECIVVFLCLGASNITGSLVSGAQDRITNVLWLKQLCSSAKDKEV